MKTNRPAPVMHCMSIDEVDEKHIRRHNKHVRRQNRNAGWWRFCNRVFNLF